MMLTQHENSKLKERDEQHTHELREWRSDLTKRRQVETALCIYTHKYGGFGLVWTDCL